MRTLLVYADFDWLPAPTLIGELATNPCVARIVTASASVRSGYKRTAGYT